MITNNLPNPCNACTCASLQSERLDEFILIRNSTVIGRCPVTTDIPVPKIGGHEINPKQQNRDFLEKTPPQFSFSSGSLLRTYPSMKFHRWCLQENNADFSESGFTGHMDSLLFCIQHPTWSTQQQFCFQGNVIKLHCI
jgi:hypothetical protein